MWDFKSCNQPHCYEEKSPQNIFVYMYSWISALKGKQNNDWSEAQNIENVYEQCSQLRPAT